MRRNGTSLQMRVETGRNEGNDQNMVGKESGLDNDHPSPLNAQRYALGVLYVGIVTYGLFFAPGSFENNNQLALILRGQVDEVNDLFFAVFNLLGAIAANFAVLLNAGAPKQKRLATWPFSLLGFVFGFGALGPYLVAREYAPSVTREDVQDRGFVSRLLESRFFSVGTVLYALWAYAFALGLFSPGTQEFHNIVFYSSWVDLTRIITSDRLAFTTCLDFVILSLLTWGPLTEDMSRRGWFTNGKELESALTAISFILVPGLGPAFYLVTRSQLPKRETPKGLDPGMN